LGDINKLLIKILVNLVEWESALKTLKSGLPVIFPTDTLPAIGCLPEFSNVIYKFKKRDKNKPLILMGSEQEQLIDYVHESAKEDYENIASKYWPGALTIVIPARNEAGNKELLIQALNKFKNIPNKLEIIFVEGNSNDNTYEILKELKDNFSNFFKISLLQQTSKGKKNAVVEGFNISSGETLAIIDSDFTVDIDDSIAAIIESKKNENILINCSRTTFTMEKNAMRWANYIGNRCFAILISILINKPVSDSLCGTKVFSRKFFNLMKKNGSWDSKSDPFGDFTIIFEAANNNIKILNYPVRYYARKSGAPNISRWVDGLKLLKVCWIYMISDI